MIGQPSNINSNISNLRGEIYCLKEDKPILLNNPQTVWVVTSGSISVFAISGKDSVKEKKHYLFSCGEGEALFGTAGNIGNNELQILAKPMGEVELIKLEPRCWQELVTAADGRVNIWVNQWLNQLDPGFFHAAEPKVNTKIFAGNQFLITNGEIIQPEQKQVFWITLQEGYARWLGFEELTLSPFTKKLPLTNAMWLTADGEAVLLAQTTKMQRNPSILLSGISEFYQYFFYCIKAWEKQESAEEQLRLQLRKQQELKIIPEALQALISPLNPQKADFYFQGDPLLVAAGAVGKHLGTNIVSPSLWEDFQDFNESLEAIAQASRLRIRPVSLKNNWWQRDCGAMVAYTKTDNRPVALLPVSGSGYELVDSVSLQRIRVDAVIAANLAANAFVFYRTLPARLLNFFDILRFAVTGLKKEQLTIFIVGITAALLGMIFPQATAILIDNAIPNRDKVLLLQIALWLLAVAVSIAVFGLVKNFSVLRVETIAESNTQTAVWDRLLNLPVSFFRQYTQGDLYSRLTFVKVIRRQLGDNAISKLISSLFALLNLGLLIYYSFKLALIAVVIAFIFVIFTTISGILLLRRIRPLLEIQGYIFGQTVQLIRGISKLRIAGAENRAFAFWSQIYAKQIEIEVSTQFIKDLVIVFNTIFPTVVSIVFFWFASKLVNQSEITGEVGLTIGTFLAFNTAFRTFVDSSVNTSNIITEILQVIPQWKRAKPIFKTDLEIKENKANPGQLIGRIVLERLSFGYRKQGAPILEDISIHAEPGEFIALVGESGSGKSTIMRLLLGFEIPESGKIYYDEKDLSGLDINTVRRQLGVVLQDDNIIPGSIFNNLAGSTKITVDAALEALNLANLTEDVASMPMGIHTFISEGGKNLSGGQRQRLLLARALARNPRLLLLDEATSALDNETQKVVSNNIEKLKITRIVIAHRLSTIRKADRIYVLHAGKIVQQGTFNELASSQGLFAKLMQRQML